MSSASEASIPAADAGSPASPGWSAAHRWLREPLFHFLAIGALLFAANAVLPTPVNRDRIIAVGPDVRQSIVETFRAQRQRDPTAEELAPLIDVWILNEITYREALAQGLDRGDEMIRERIMQKMRVLVFGNVNVADPTDADLQAWLEAHRAHYDQPETLSFFDLPIESADAGAEAAGVLAQIEAEAEPEAVRLRARAFVKRPRKTIVEAFGQDFVDALAVLPIGRWQKIPSAKGWHIVRLDAVEGGRAASVEELRDKLFTDLKQDRIRTAAVSTIRDMGKAYTIRRGDQP